MDDEEEKIGEGRGGEVEMLQHADIRHTDPPTKRVLEEHSLLKTLFWLIYLKTLKKFTFLGPFISI